MISKILVGCIGIIILMVVLAIAYTVVIMLMWNWVVPDVFAGAITHGILPSEITILQALKLGLLLSILTGGSSVASSSKK